MRKYDSYKDSGIEWIGEIPSHWEKYRLGVIGKFTSSGIDKKLIDNEPEVKIINYTDIYGNGTAILDSSIDYMVVTTPQSKIDEHSVKKGDLIFTPSSETKEDIGLSAVVIEDLENTAFSYHVLRFQFDRNVDVNFKKYLCNNHFVLNHFSRNSQGTTRQTLGRNDFKNAGIILPPEQEQTAIAAYLDRKTAEIDELIADKKRLLELYEEEKTAIINQAVTKGINPDAPMKDSGIEWLGEIPEHWEVKRFKYYFNIITEKVEEDLPKIGLENIESKSGRFIETDTEFAGQGVRFRPKDILFGKLRPYLAKVWLSNFDGQAVGDFYVFRSKQDVIPEFAKYRILDSSFIEVTNSSTYGSKMPRVSWEFISDLPIAFPKIHEQESIVQHIEAECTLIDSKKAKTEKLIELLTEYRTALISEVVTGKVKVI